MKHQSPKKQILVINEVRWANLTPGFLYVFVTRTPLLETQSITEVRTFNHIMLYTPHFWFIQQVYKKLSGNLAVHHVSETSCFAQAGPFHKYRTGNICIECTCCIVQALGSVTLLVYALYSRKMHGLLHLPFVTGSMALQISHDCWIQLLHCGEGPSWHATS